ncbi:spermidine/putrescine ABC transporter ATP-binding protein [Aneurinibacillus migulanus]|uniref:ABC transporter ATP-binding protein n=1 Tax=Aneurinibacillus migulanus TaxID=47500 RepID=UPI0005BA81AE|nr:ABC transporter ATP-binding protein [Aneurinibacillus migulanus]KIV57150.1 spermidine/putrescine ABC transporter ATP-binding protein [Aneurinibacillus migulanus]KPD07587.1 spermidine/putrescine ABC transporter ATP-binding protein [Aneurinibacillus migulanus]MCP1357841.1 ABC transporter ATP-binding protein [Aneurinibacillus migulanus]CEH28835.1 ABC transporter, ATP-binding protein [Aneurinibacillus migulanus]
MSDVLVKFQHVSKKYQSKVAVHNISFELPRGKIIGLIGTNGSGKSTMLKLMAGLIRPTRGMVMINGEQIKRRIPEQVSFLPDGDHLYPFYTVQQTIDVFSSIYSDFDKKKAIEMLTFMELPGDQFIKVLSKGNKGRLKIILALSRQVPLILMDEPLSGLDPIVRNSIIKSLISFIDVERQTVIMSTHEVAEVEPILDMAVLIHNGELQSIQEVEQIRFTSNMSLVEWMKKSAK